MNRWTTCWPSTAKRCSRNGRGKCGITTSTAAKSWPFRSASATCPAIPTWCAKIFAKLGVPPIKTYEDLIDFAYKVKEQEKGIIPMTAGSGTYTFVAHHALNDYETHVRPTHALGNSLMLYYKNNDGKVYNLLEDREPIGTWLANTRKWFTDGLIFKDILTTKIFISRSRQAKWQSSRTARSASAILSRTR